ncbi:MAG: phosphatidate cytidylyltransferase [Tissierellia bacterium]|nr:phosphatidate cytidylyltransferase [Tissierellia bacterium]
MKFLSRVIGGAFIIAILVAITLIGRTALFIGVTVFSSIGLYEIRRCFKNMSYNFPLVLALIFNLMIMITAFLNSNNLYIFVLVLITMITLVYMTFNKRYRPVDLAVMFFSLLYVSFLMSHMLRFNSTKYHWLLYIYAWGTDTFAYLVGSKIGKHKIELVSHISPNKTLEGSIGGVVGCLILALIYNAYANLGINVFLLILFTIVCSILSQIGDLIASFIKRKANVKDYGNLIMGHGGILDRFDSMLFISPIVYFITLI